MITQNHQAAKLSHPLNSCHSVNPHSVNPHIPPYFQEKIVTMVSTKRRQWPMTTGKRGHNDCYILHFCKPY
ncbi:hypothetical protein K450DRAFT_228677 [Umbelopsis ramanniana AG]|uniref:Uncharacterized protein n=1 Tax=Umbelopsis ramanniana AG TaxID=1314678 RepID=A0AAD5EG35_UMBRA|nr:uncharacterized protein K450DRAFT_228677 [Umbelopsis ramanniana AG]KAI8582380.1 hypothetical protein K450DRAFT_228677 [Umbelopsis ramanniana AG]